MNGSAIPFVVLPAMYEVKYSYLSAGFWGGTNLVLMFYSEVVVVVLKLLTLLIINASTIYSWLCISGTAQCVNDVTC